MQGTVPAFSFSCSARRQERRLEPPVCVQTARRRHSRRAFRKTPCSSKQAQVLESRVFPGNSRTTHLGPFGELIRATGPMAKLNPIRFSTKYQDDETGLLYYGYRYYNPSTGRWPNRDPLLELTFHVLNRVDLDEDTDFNIYELLGNDPLSKIDMLGAGWRCYCDAEASLLPPGSEFMHRVGDDAGNSIECTDSTQGATVTQHRSYMCGNRMFVPYCLYSCYKHNCTLTWVYVCSHKKTPDKKGKYPALWFVKSASVTTKCP